MPFAPTPRVVFFFGAASLLASLAAPARAVTIDWVTVGDAGNAADTTGYGAVTDAFQIMKYEFTNQEYTDFLNSVDRGGSNPYSIYNANMGSDARGGISFTSGASFGSKYSIKSNMGNKPVNFVDWFAAARVSNWLMNGATSSSDTETGAYTLNGVTSGSAPAVNPGAIFHVPTENQWYKAAYYKGGSPNAGYWAYATESNVAPTSGAADATGDGLAGGTGKFANWNTAADWNGQNGNVTTVGTNGGSSAYGAFDLSGNVWEWNDLTGAASSSRGTRGASWGDILAVYLSRSARSEGDPSDENIGGGFRLAAPVAVPEPAACIMALAGIACGGYVVRRRRILSYACLLLALAVVPSAVHAATFFTDDFNSSAANSSLTVPAGWTFGGNSSPAGVAQNNGLVTDPGPEPPDTETTYTPRTYVSTVATNFNSSDFIYEITFAVGGGGGNIAFFGIGSGQPNTGFYDEPYSAFFLRQFPSSFSSGETGWTISSPADPTRPSENTFPSSGTGDGTYRAQLVKSSNSLTLGIDANFTGGPFAADFTVTKNLLTDLSFLDSTNSALFFGTAGTDTTFDNLSITAVPEPSTCIMALAGLACGGFSMWQRRKRAAV